ncbi:MAG: hypothetical protein ACI8W8_003503 [Rhodothermales bacterium]|jgi:hypothetical protein
MAQLPWIVVGILTVLLLVAVVLWQRARLKGEAASDTLAEVDAALAKQGSGGLSDFPESAIFRLLAKGQINLGGKVHSFGVTQAESGQTQAFLTLSSMSHLVAGDSFSALRGNLHKVDAGAPPASQPAAQTAPVAKLAPTPAPPPPPIDEDEDEFIGDRTVMFAPTRGAITPAEDPMAGFPNLLVHAGPDTGTRFPLPFTHATIGRDKGNIIALGDNGSSRIHCEIFYRSGEFILTDANSTNGTFCNDEKITERVLEFGDRVQVADTVMEFTFEGNEVKDTDPNAAIAAFEKCLAREPNFLLALKNLAFLLERDVRRKKEADPLWKKIIEVEQSR